MRISDWSSDVCSSDLRTYRGTAVAQADLPGRPLLGTGALLPAALAGDRLRARRPEVDGGLRPPAGADQGRHPREFRPAQGAQPARATALQGHGGLDRRAAALRLHQGKLRAADGGDVAWLRLDRRHAGRSEEHTSELQSLMRISYAVLCLKKKNKAPMKKIYGFNKETKQQQIQYNHIKDKVESIAQTQHTKNIKITTISSCCQ